MARRKALTSITAGMFLIPLSALVMASGNLFHGDLLGFHPITVMMVARKMMMAMICMVSTVDHVPFRRAPAGGVLGAPGCKNGKFLQ